MVASASATLCWNCIEREENEITRHLREEEGANTGRGHTHYDSCRLIPEQVAVELVAQQRVDYLTGLRIPTLNSSPKTPWGTIAEIRGIFNQRQIQVPVWLNLLTLPPTGNPNVTYRVAVPPAGILQPAAPPVAQAQAPPAPQTPAARSPDAQAQVTPPADIDPEEEPHESPSDFRERMQDLEDSRQYDRWKEEQECQGQY